MKDKTLSIRISAELLERLRQEAKAQDRSMGNLIARILDKNLPL